MLNALISSGTKRAILKQFFLNPDKKYYIRQMATILDISVGTVHRELVGLEKSGILESERIANLRFFYINKKNPLFAELKQIIFKTEGIKGKMKMELNRIKDVRVAFIYGSFAKGEEKGNSDIDLFLVGNINEDELIGRISNLEGEFNREINYTIYTKEEFKKEIENKNSFILEVLKEPKIFLIGKENEL